jgi:hypothetical protein
VLLLWAAFRFLRQDLMAASDLLGRAPLTLPTDLVLVLVVGGMAVGVAGSLVSLRRVRV